MTLVTEPQFLDSHTNRFGKKVVKVVLTGGPCAGKSTVIQEIRDRIEKDYSENWQVFTAAEASSLLYSGGVARDELTRSQLAQWQLDMLKTIFRIEEVFDNIATNEPRRHTLILCDRGALDPKVFTPMDIWPWILAQMDMSETELVHRYDKVVQLQTAPRVNYTCQNNKFRREDYERAQIVNEQYKEVWKVHPNFVNILDNENDCWTTKAAEAWQQVKVLLTDD